ncbi:MAG: RNA polymerase sigma factor [Acidobacteria bacterium]|nr:RNA polymerase sigma factor [Acidobacteriota bacterium]MCZ6726045.1 RNA polymerase sigma factor [Acidobacteriota bacterium]
MPTLVHSATKERARFSELEDRELLLALADGEEAALDELIDRKSAPLLQLVWRVVGDREDARDIVQLTFLRAWQHRERYDPRFSPNTWLYRIATNLGIDLLRSRMAKNRRREPVRSHFVRLADLRRSSVGELEDREVTSILHELADALSERQRAVFVLREVEGLPSAEVAEILGCQASTVRNHLFSARKILRRELVRRYPEYSAGLRRRGSIEGTP